MFNYSWMRLKKMNVMMSVSAPRKFSTKQLHGTSFMVQHDAGMTVAGDYGKSGILVYPVIAI